MTSLGAALLAAIDALAADLQAAGLVATDDPSAVTGPGVWLSPASIDLDADDATWGIVPASIDVWLVAPAVEGAPRVLAGLLDQATAVADPAGRVDAGLVLELPRAALPAWRYSTTRDLTL